MREIVVTGAFGLIGSATVRLLNERGIVPYVIDRWEDNDLKWRNVRGLRFKRIDELGIILLDSPIIIALGASVDTKEGMSERLWQNNVDTLLRLYDRASKFIYASSAAVYGSSTDFRERLDVTPLCPYAQTKAYVDQQLFGGGEPKIPTYAIRPFNVFGPREVHKGDMASLVTKGLLKQEPLYQTGFGYHDEIREPHWSLFESPTSDPIERDLIYVDDVASILLHFALNDGIPSGVYNGGTGISRSFDDLVTAIEDLPIKHVPLPDALRGQYQSRTRADITKLRGVGYDKPFTTLEEGIEKTRAWMKEEGLLKDA